MGPRVGWDRHTHIGPHARADGKANGGLTVRAFLPEADSVTLVTGEGEAHPMPRLRPEGFFELDLPRSVRAAVEAQLRGQARSPADFAWAIADAFERSGDARRAAGFYRQVARLEPKTDRGKAAAAKAKRLAPTP